jgi:hypothetical protein
LISRILISLRPGVEALAMSLRSNPPTRLGPGAKDTVLTVGGFFLS